MKKIKVIPKAQRTTIYAAMLKLLTETIKSHGLCRCMQIVTDNIIAYSIYNFDAGDILHYVQNNSNEFVTLETSEHGAIKSLLMNKYPELKQAALEFNATFNNMYWWNDNDIKTRIKVVTRAIELLTTKK